MTPQEKAKELLGKYYIVCQEYTEEIQCSIQAKQCALIAVDESILRQKDLLSKIRSRVNSSNAIEIITSELDYLQQVKQEIENL
jgi:hypothetical protein